MTKYDPNAVFAALAALPGKQGAWFKRYEGMILFLLELDLADKASLLKHIDLSNNITDEDIVKLKRRLKSLLDEHVDRLPQKTREEYGWFAQQFPACYFRHFMLTHAIPVTRAILEDRIASLVNELVITHPLGSHYWKDAHNILTTTLERIPLQRKNGRVYEHKTGWLRFLLDCEMDAEDREEFDSLFCDFIDSLSRHISSTNGQPTSLKDFFEEYSDAIWKQVRWRIKDQQDAEDIFSNIMYGLIDDGYRLIRRWDPGKSKATYMTFLVQQAIRDYYNAHQGTVDVGDQDNNIPDETDTGQSSSSGPRRVDLDDNIPADIDAVEDLIAGLPILSIESGDIDRACFTDIFRSEWSRLSEDDQLIVLWKLENIPSKEIAEKLNMIPKNVDKRYSEFVRRLRPKVLFACVDWEAWQTEAGHITPEDILEYLDAKVHMQSIDEHISGCPPCKKLFKEVEKIANDFNTRIEKLFDLRESIWEVHDDPTPVTKSLRDQIHVIFRNESLTISNISHPLRWYQIQRRTRTSTRGTPVSEGPPPELVDELKAILSEPVWASDLNARLRWPLRKHRSQDRETAQTAQELILPDGGYQYTLSFHTARNRDSDDVLFHIFLQIETEDGETLDGEGRLLLVKQDDEAYHLVIERYFVLKDAARLDSLHPGSYQLTFAFQNQKRIIPFQLMR